MTAQAATQTRAVFAFDRPPFASWCSLDDGVMGGRSRSTLTVAPGTATFSGFVSFENNGGFCSVRSPDFAAGWAGYQGVALLARGDGKTYTFCLHTRALMPGMSYRCRFTPPAGEWADLHLPFDDFVLMRFGFRVGVEPVNPDHVRGVSLMIADKQDGPFALDLGRIAVWG
jgi:NADH dehydrogenase [ubiquinone] 1 alpha subcomplex assembly factor 1